MTPNGTAMSLTPAQQETLDTIWGAGPGRVRGGQRNTPHAVSTRRARGLVALGYAHESSAGFILTRRGHHAVRGHRDTFRRATMDLAIAYRAHLAGQP